MENRRHNSCQQHNCEIISKDRNKITQNKYAQYQKHHLLPVDARKKQRHHRTGCSHCQSKQTDQQTGLCDTDTKFMNFYPFNDIETISPRPLLFITGDQAHSKEFSEDAYKRAAEPKELYYVAGAGHVDLYDRVELIPFDKLESFFKANLK